MGQKNAASKRFCGDKNRFADLVNGLYFGGRNVIRPEDLTGAGEVYTQSCAGAAEETTAGKTGKQRGIHPYDRG